MVVTGRMGIAWEILNYIKKKFEKKINLDIDELDTVL